MRYLSVCSGIEAATVAWHPLGWEPAAFSEIEEFPSSVLAHHYPDVPNLGDMNRYKEWDLGCTCIQTGTKRGGGSGVRNRRSRSDTSGPEQRLHGSAGGGHSTGGGCETCGRSDIDVLVGGTPCQSFSVAGLRKGMDDPRGNLALVFLGIADRFRPRWVVWENVPGVLSSNGGRDFGSFLGGLGELGYGFAYRVLDAQYIRVESHARAVPQRRRRVFVVGYLGDWRRAAAVLFERESLSGYPAPRREAGERAAGGAASCLRSGGDGGVPSSRGEHIVAEVGFGIDYENNAHGIEDATGPLLKGSPTGGGRPLPAVCVAEVGPTMGASGPPYSRTGQQGSESEALVAFLDRAAFNQGENAQFEPEITEGAETAASLVARGPHAVGVPGVANPLTHRMHKDINTTLDEGQTPIVFDTTQPAVAFQSNMSRIDLHEDGASPTVKPGGQGGNPPAVATNYAVRRLTPMECERLQGFPDHYTQIAWPARHSRSCAIYDDEDESLLCDCDPVMLPPEECPDGHRYRALGNSFAVNVVRWIGERIQMVDDLP